MKVQISERCPCGAHLTLSDELPAEARHIRYSVHCDRCYEPVEDAHAKETCLGYGKTPEGAYADWWEQAGEAWHIDDLGWSVATTLADLEKQVLFELDAQKGWKTRPSWLQPNQDVWFGPDLIGYLQTANALSETEGK